MASSSQPTTSSSFELYENEFNTIIGRCNHSLARLVANNYTSDSTGSPPSKVIGDAEQSMQELAALMKSMQLEATSYSSRSSVRTTMDDKLAKLKLSMAQLRSDLRSVKDEQSSRELFGASGSGESSSLSLEQRSKMLKQTEQLEKTSERIKESKRIAAETEALGAQVLDDLSSQGQVLDRARGNLGNVNQDITRSFGIVGTMNRREWINKIAIYLVIGGFAAACFGLIIYRFSKK